MPGRDTTRTLVVGAHYDHLGYGGESSLTPDAHVPHVGADDNASGVAALLGVARHAAPEARAGRRPDAQPGVLRLHRRGDGAGRLVALRRRPDRGRSRRVEAMLNMDMVGRLRDDKLMVMGAGTAAEFPALVDEREPRSGELRPQDLERRLRPERPLVVLQEARCRC